MAYGSSINPPSILKRKADGKLVSAFVEKKKPTKKKKKHKRNYIPQIIPKQVIDWANENRNNPTPFEKEVCEWLDHYGIKYEFQKPVCTGKRYYILDFSLRINGKKICLEIDGRHHFTKEGMAKDKERSKNIRKIGYSTIRFSNSDVIKKPYEIIGLLQFLEYK